MISQTFSEAADLHGVSQHCDEVLVLQVRHLHQVFEEGVRLLRRAALELLRHGLPRIGRKGLQVVQNLVTQRHYHCAQSNAVQELVDPLCLAHKQLSFSNPVLN